jgi:hypothetical protein
VTAIFASNDAMALGAMRALHEAGRDVPGSVSVVGFDDMELSADFRPPLTTVHQYFDRVATAAVGMLIDRIEHQKRTTADTVPTELIVRASTAPPRDRGRRGSAEPGSAVLDAAEREPELEVSRRQQVPVERTRTPGVVSRHPRRISAGRTIVRWIGGSSCGCSALSISAGVQLSAENSMIGSPRSADPRPGHP